MLELSASNFAAVSEADGNLHDYEGFALVLRLLHRGLLV